MRLTLVDNLLLPERGDPSNAEVHPHLGLLSLVAVARRAGHEASIFDPKRALRERSLRYDGSLYRDAAERIATARPEAVGFTTLGCSMLFTLKVARHLKRLAPELPILLGGPHATILHRELLTRYPEFDVVVRHEAEEILLPVLEALERREFGAIPGVSWRVNGVFCANPGAPRVEDLDTLPFPAYEHAELEELGLETLRIDAGRGCPFACTFCSTASYFGRSYRLKSPQRLVAEMDALNARYGVTDFRLNHDLFTVNKRKVHAFCEAVRGRGYTWAVSARIDCVDEPLLEAMAATGCRGIYFGIETGSERMQRVVEKRLDLRLLEPTLDVVGRLGIRATVSFITGYPQERLEDQDATLDWLGRCSQRNEQHIHTQLHMLSPEPGTGLYQRFKETLRYDAYVTDFNGEPLEADDEALIVADPEVFVTHYYFETELSRGRNRFVTDAYQLLVCGGLTLLGYALRFYSGRMSLLVGELYDWAVAKGREGDIGSALLLDYLRDRHEPNSHLTSLYRYALATDSARRVIADEPVNPAGQPESLDLDCPYMLAPRARLFEDLHDCPSLFERIAAQHPQSPPLSERDAGPRGYFLAIGKSCREGTLTNFALNAVSHATLKLFETPRTPRATRTLLAHAAELNPDIIDLSFFEHAVAVGALRRCNVAPRHSLTAATRATRGTLGSTRAWPRVAPPSPKLREAEERVPDLVVTANLSSRWK